MKKNELILDSNKVINILGKDYKDLSTIFSDKFGIVNAILERNELSKYGMHMYQCLSADTRILFNIDRDVSSGGLGISESKRGAMVSCLAEALERYCMSYIPKNEILYSYKKDIDNELTFNDFAHITISNIESPIFF